jgi:O-antigen/teichoic acid export membrane protein
LKFDLSFLDNKIYRETIWSFSAKGIASLLYIGINIFLARYLGPLRFGTWSYFYALINIILIFSYFGINASSRKYIAQFNYTDNLGAVLRSSLKLRLVFSFCFVIIYIILQKILVDLLGRPDLQLLFIAAVPIIFFASLVEYFKNAFQGLHSLKSNFFVVLSEHGFRLILVPLFLLFLNGLVGVVHSYAIGFFLTFIVGFSIYYSTLRRVNCHSAKKFEIDILKYSVPLILISIGYSIMVEIDTIMIAMLKTDSEVGIYAAAKQIAIKLPQISLALSLGVMPLFAQMNSENKIKLIRLYYNLLKANTIIFGVIGFMILSSSWFFVPLIYGDQYKASILPLMALVPFLIVSSYSVFLSAFLEYRGKAKKRAINLFIVLILNILLNIVLIPIYGALGAAIASSVSCIPGLYLNWSEVKKELV